MNQRKWFLAYDMKDGRKNVVLHKFDKKPDAAQISDADKMVRQVCDTDGGPFLWGTA